MPKYDALAIIEERIVHDDMLLCMITQNSRKRMYTITSILFFPHYDVNFTAVLLLQFYCACHSRIGDINKCSRQDLSRILYFKHQTYTK